MGWAVAALLLVLSYWLGTRSGRARARRRLLEWSGEHHESGSCYSACEDCGRLASVTHAGSPDAGAPCVGVVLRLLAEGL